MARIKDCCQETIDASGNSQFTFGYELCAGEGRAMRKIKVCRTVMAAAYGYTLYEFKLAVAQFKTSSFGEAPAKRFHTWKDSTVHNISFNETVDIAKTNDIYFSEQETR